MSVVASPPPPRLRLARVRQPFALSVHLDPSALLVPQLQPRLAHLAPGSRIAVAIGSRGIHALADIVQAVLEMIRSAGAVPFLIPAMGSHGGATPEGQTQLLAGFGVSTDRLKVAVEASMEVTGLGAALPGYEVVCSTPALQADGVLLINRVKPHTDFAGRLGSGLAKMLVVGLGKHAGAAAFHRAASRLGHEAVLRAGATRVLERLPLLGGIAIVEDANHRPSHLEVVPPERLLEREEALCALAHQQMARLPFAELDLLIVDRMGKNLSGTGMDPAIIGRLIHGYSLAEDQPRRSPHIRRLFVRELTPESHGNAIGLGLADFTTTRLVRAMDPQVTRINALTALSLQGAKVPIHFDTDAESLACALDTLGLPDPARARVVRVRDTLSVRELLVSEACLQDPAARQLEVIHPLREVEYDSQGNLTDW